MNLIPNNETATNSKWSTNSNNLSNNLVTNRNWDVENDNSPSQWMLNSNQNSNQTSNINSSNSQINQVINQNDLDAASLINEQHKNKNWSQIEKNNQNTNCLNNSSSSNQLDNLSNQTNDLNNDLTKTNAIKEASPFDKFTNIQLYSDDWGNVEINQNTPWNFNQSSANYQPPPREVQSYNGLIDNSWKYSSLTTGTDIWEANIRKRSNDQNLDLISQQANSKNAQNLNSNASALNHFGGTWGEDENINPNNNWITENNGDKSSNWTKKWAEDEKINSLNNNINKPVNDALFSTWNSNLVKKENKDLNWNDNESAITANDLNDGTELWKRQNITFWKTDEKDDLMKQNKMNNLTNSCANSNNAHMQNNGFSTTSPGVLRAPNVNTNQINKVQTINNSITINNNPNNQNGMFWNDQTNNQLNNNWNKSNNLNKEMILRSNEFKILLEKGFKKENVEIALRNSNMNMKDAIDELRVESLKENGNDLDRRKNSGFNNTSSLPPNSSINRNTSQFNQMPQIQQLQPNQMYRNNNNNNLNKTPNTANAMLQDKRLGNLVQQIQLAVQSGHLNAQILHQPLSVNTIQLIYQLLQQIKTLQNLQLTTPNMNKNQSDLNVQITMAKQRIASLQNQIKVQQAQFINQQQNQSGSNLAADLNGLNINSSNLPILNNNEFKQNNLISPTDSSNLINDFRDLQVNNNLQPNQSRLSTWKNSNFENNNSTIANNNSQGFSRAPGSIKNTNNNWQTTGNSNNFTAIDETWNLNDAVTNGISTNDLNVLNMNQVVQNQQFINDSVVEFEPGKPWKGKQKSSDDDPHLTPGSVNRSIISLNSFNNWPTKNNSIANNLQSAANLPTSNNTWGYNNGNQQSNSPSWNANSFNNNDSPASVENLWQQSGISSSMQKIKGPPPGLNSPNKNGNSNNKSNSLCLLIKNLTPQIDGSTLNTLARQHGLLQMFTLCNGFALVKYNTKEEAIKAQSALNNCPLSNTTIFVDFISEVEAANYLKNQQLNQQQPNLMNWNNSNNLASNGYRNANQSMINGNPWRNTIANESQWTFGNSILWNNSMDHSASMQNLLPENLLNGESA